MSLFVDTSVWSLVLRRDGDLSAPAALAVRNALERGEAVVTTGLVLQELLQGFSGPRQRDEIIEKFSALGFLSPDRHDHIEAAELRNRCRREGIQIGTIDALLAQLCLRHELVLLTTNKDFSGVAKHSSLRLWN